MSAAVAVGMAVGAITSALLVPRMPAWRRPGPGGPPGLQNRCEQRPCSGGFDSRPPPRTGTRTNRGRDKVGRLSCMSVDPAATRSDATLGAKTVVVELGTAKAGPASQPAAGGRSSGGPTAPSGWPASAPVGPSGAARRGVPAAPTDPTNSGEGIVADGPLTHRPGQPRQRPTGRTLSRAPCGRPSRQIDSRLGGVAAADATRIAARRRVPVAL